MTQDEVRAYDKDHQKQLEFKLNCSDDDFPASAQCAHGHKLPQLFLLGGLHELNWA